MLAKRLAGLDKQETALTLPPLSLRSWAAAAPSGLVSSMTCPVLTPSGRGARWRCSMLGGEIDMGMHCVLIT